MVLLHNSVNSVTTHEFHEKKEFYVNNIPSSQQDKINSIEKVSCVECLWF